jgi:hypothetical protein
MLSFFQQIDILHESLMSVDIPEDIETPQAAMPVNPRTLEPTFPGVSFDLEESLGDLPDFRDVEALLASEGIDMDGLIGPDPVMPGPLDPEDLAADQAIPSASAQPEMPPPPSEFQDLAPSSASTSAQPEPEPEAQQVSRQSNVSQHDMSLAKKSFFKKLTRVSANKQKKSL